MHSKVDIIRLPHHGKAIIVTDLHGNWNDFEKVMELWEETSRKEYHLIITGDFIHAMGRENDRSVDILEKVMYEWGRHENFHLLLGNHEWATLTRMSVYKGGINVTLNFEDLLQDKFQDDWESKLNEYTRFLRKLPLAVITANKVFISHAGPPKNIMSLDELIHLTKDGYMDNQSLFEILWCRHGDYSKKDVDLFLEAVGCKAMIVGHTPVNGFKLIGNQLVISSSYSQGKKSYVELDLEKDIRGAKDLKKMIKYF